MDSRARAKRTGLYLLLAAVVASWCLLFWDGGSDAARPAPDRDAPVASPADMNDREAASAASGAGAAARPLAAPDPGSAQAPAALGGASDPTAPAAQAQPGAEGEAHDVVATRAEIQPSSFAWEGAGLCRAWTLPQQIELRRTLQQAVPQRWSDPVIFADARISDDDLALVIRSLKNVAFWVHRSLDVQATWPEIYLYADRQALQKSSCTHPDEVAYYDGAIHLVLDGEFEWLKSLKHEYVHHVLASVGIREPFWFQEGAAMRIADDAWWLERWSAGLITVKHFDEMVAGHSHGAEEDDLVNRYAQAALMLELVRMLPSRVDLKAQMRALRSGETSASELFQWSAPGSGFPLQGALEDLATAKDRIPAWKSKYSAVTPP